VQCDQVEVKPPDYDRITSISFQYSEHISRLHRSTTTGGEANVGVPGIFDVEGSYRTERATRTDERTIREHKSFSHLILKARVLFGYDKISLTEEFVAAIREAVGEPEPAKKLLDVPAKKLLDVLGRYGQFFASDMMLGGRLNYWTDKILGESHTEKQDHDSFQLATKAKATADGVPVEGGADWAYGHTDGEKRLSSLRRPHSF